MPAEMMVPRVFFYKSRVFLPGRVSTSVQDGDNPCGKTKILYP